MQLSQSQSSLQQLQRQFSQEREHLRMQLDELQKEHQRRQQRLQEVHCCSLRDMEHARQRDLKVHTVLTGSRSRLLWAANGAGEILGSFEFSSLLEAALI